MVKLPSGMTVHQNVETRHTTIAMTDRTEHWVPLKTLSKAVAAVVMVGPGLILLAILLARHSLS